MIETAGVRREELMPAVASAASMNVKPCLKIQQPRVVIVGGGFGGLEAAKALARLPVQITLVDRKNHHTFQPLLYQVATAGLSPAEIAAPIREILARHDNVEVLLGEVLGVDVERRIVKLHGFELPYDYLVVAAGATHAYFGHDEWEPLAPGLKTVEDALEMRRRILLAYELAEREAALTGRHRPLSFVVVGGGPDRCGAGRNAGRDCPQIADRRFSPHRSRKDPHPAGGGRSRRAERLSSGPAPQRRRATATTRRRGPHQRGRDRCALRRGARGE